MTYPQTTCRFQGLYKATRTRRPKTVVNNDRALGLGFSRSQHLQVLSLAFVHRFVYFIATPLTCTITIGIIAILYQSILVLLQLESF